MNWSNSRFLGNCLHGRCLKEFDIKEIRLITIELSSELILVESVRIAIMRFKLLCAE